VKLTVGTALFFFKSQKYFVQALILLLTGQK